MNVRRVNAPCYECQLKHTGCHASCGRYKDYCKARNEEKIRIYKANAGGILEELVKNDAIRRAKERNRRAKRR